MADVIRITRDRVVLRVHVPRTAFELMTSVYPSEGLALADLRTALPALLQLLLERRTAEIDAASTDLRDSA